MCDSGVFITEVAVVKGVVKLWHSLKPSSTPRTSATYTLTLAVSCIFMCQGPGARRPGDVQTQQLSESADEASLRAANTMFGSK